MPTLNGCFASKAVGQVLVFELWRAAAFDPKKTFSILRNQVIGPRAVETFLLKIRYGACTLVLSLVLISTASSADDPSAAYPITIEGLRQLAAHDAELDRCTSGQVPRRCWGCKEQVCSHWERVGYSGWSVSSNVFVSADGEDLSCDVSAAAIRIVIDYLSDSPQITFQVPGRKNITLHEARSVHLFLDGERYTNPSDGPYLKMAFENGQGSIVHRQELLEKMQSAYRITVEVWNVDDEKVTTVEHGEGLSNAILHCNAFATNALARE